MRGEILLVGDARERDAIAGVLDQLAPFSVGLDDVTAAIDRVGAGTRAILLLAGDDARELLRRLRGGIGIRQVPIVLLLGPDAIDEERASGLYDAGATAVLAWPSESLLLPRLLLALQGAEGDAINVGECPLEQAVRARLQADPVLDTSIEVHVIGATALLHGSVESAWERSRLRRVVEAIPGIARVVDYGVTVHALPIADSELRATAEAIVRSAGNTEARDLHVEVEDAVATVWGAASSRGTVTRVCNAIRQVPGIRRVYDSTHVDRP